VRFVLLLGLLVVLGLQLRARGCQFQEAGPPPLPSGTPGVTLQLFAEGLSRPVHLVAPPGDHERVFVVEQTGRVVVFRGGRRLPEPFLDLSDRTTRSWRMGNEQGLLGLAFHPRYKENRRFFVNYTDRKGTTRVVAYEADPDAPDRADPATARVLLTVKQPYGNHNGGHVIFGPEGYLYIPLGDGGSAGDPKGNGANPRTLLGSLLRIDVDRGDPYAIPSDNPFRDGRSGRPEVWAYGLRNPWRIAFDGDHIFIADVGQNRWEEVNVALRTAAGLNYGWNATEGLHPFRSRKADWTGITRPVVEYSHKVGVSITGGVVYRGEALRDVMAGHYFYADYATAIIRSFRYEKGRVVDQRDWTDVLNPGTVRVTNISSFGVDGRGELYILGLRGKIFKVVPGPL
jgi:glucose/arabinose dehydrogenase